MKSTCIRLGCILTYLIMPVPVWAQWTVEIHEAYESGEQIKAAVTRNNDGYKLEVYRDENGVVRSRFSTEKTLTRIDSQYCPTFDVVNRGMQNVSINGESCLVESSWTEFILGYINNNQVISNPLYNFMNGREIVYRFKKFPYGYAETSFSLNRSKQALLEALGFNLTVQTDKGYSN